MQSIKPQFCVEAIVANQLDKTILIQQRSATRKLFPLCWEFMGGHVEPGETIEDCIRRELLEESGMNLVLIVAKLHEFEWKHEGHCYKDLVYLVEASGTPRLEEGKAINLKWIQRDEISLLLRDGELTNGLYEAAVKAFGVMVF